MTAKDYRQLALICGTLMGQGKLAWVQVHDIADALSDVNGNFLKNRFMVAVRERELVLARREARDDSRRSIPRSAPRPPPSRPSWRKTSRAGVQQRRT